MDGAVDDEEADAEDCIHQVVHGEVVRQIHQPEEVATGHALQAVLAAGGLHLQHDEVDHLGQGQGDHRKVDARAPDGQNAEQPAQKAGRYRAGEDADLGGDPHVAHHQSADVAGCAQEGRMPEGQQAGKTEEQVEGAGEQGEAEKLHQKGRVDREGGDQTDDEQARVQDFSLDQGGGLLGCAHGESFQALPNRPAGRTSRTMTMMTKTTTAEASG